VFIATQTGFSSPEVFAGGALARTILVRATALRSPFAQPALHPGDREARAPACRLIVDFSALKRSRQGSQIVAGRSSGAMTTG
jgi:hypothetical protein